MKIITFDHIIEINKLLKDACGKQSMELKKIEENDIDVDDHVYRIIEQKFKEFGINIEYSINKKYITVI